MPYGIIILLCVVALAAVYVFASEASWWSKALVLVTLAGSFAWRYGIFLRVILGIWLALHFTYLRACADRGK